MRIHKEGYALILGTLLFCAAVDAAAYYALPEAFFWFIVVVSVAFFGIVLQFFRNPIRTIPIVDNNLIYAPCDGKVVVIEEVEEPEYFKDRRIQVSIFMSPLNVHVNRNPISGLVKYFRYHEGKYLVAWHPKSSTENERTTTVIAQGTKEVLFRQIAGALAKRIIAYVKEGEEVTQGADMGFIKFGSRVDIFLPLDAKIKVNLEEKAFGNKTVIATFE